MRFSQDFIDKVRGANSIVEIIGQYTELKGNGHRMMGRCPFPDHNEKTPSFSVTEDNQLYYCYGCKKGGNVFTFLETFNGMNFPEAVEFLARRQNIALPESDAPNQKTNASRDQKELLLKVNKTAAIFYYTQLKEQPENSPVREYLKKRGLSADTVEKFRLGVALEEWQGLINHFQARNVPMAPAEALGLIKLKKAGRPGDTHFDLFRDRLMFPIFNSTSDVIGFGGRTLQVDGIPKYLNSSDSPLFNKSRVLYGIHETGKFIRAQDSAIVVEGYMDAIALYTAGIKNVVAILGTAFTPDHAKILKRYTMNVTMLLDGDEAGLNGAERSLPILLEAGMMPKGFALPDKMDPDDYVKANGTEKLQNEIERAPELFNLLLTKRWLQGYHGSASEKVRIVDEAAISLSRMSNRGLLDLYLLELARQLDVEVGWVRRTLQQATQGKATAGGLAPPVSTQVPGGPRPNGSPPYIAPVVAAPKPEESTSVLEEAVSRVKLKDAPKDEAFVLSLILHFENLMRELIEAGTDEVLTLFTHDGVKKVLQEAIDLYRLKPENFDGIASNLASKVDQPAVLLSSMAVVTGDEREGFERKLMGDYLGAIRRRHLKKQAKEIATTLKDGQNPAELEQKLEALMSLNRDRMQVNKEK